VSIIAVQLVILGLLAAGVGLYLRSRQRGPRACPSCGRTIDAGAIACPQCGRPLGPNLGRIGMLFAVVLVLLLVVGLILAETGH
jgi:hypothetical protein